MVVSRFFIALQKRLLRENTLAKAIKAKVNDWETVFCGFDGFGGSSSFRKYYNFKSVCVLISRKKY